jgi:hypothetical protein
MLKMPGDPRSGPLRSRPVSSNPRRELGAAAFSGDDGSADPQVEAALAAYASGSGGQADVIDALSNGRLMVPVVAVLDEAGESADGHRTDKSSHMATVLTTGRDGRRGLLAFTCVDTMRAWNPSARPVPVATRRAAESALADAADALVIDIAGPVVFSVDAADLRALASGWRPVSDGHGGTAWAVAVGLARSGAPDGGDEPVEAGVAGKPSAPIRLAHRKAGKVRRRVRRVFEVVRSRGR